MADRLLHSVRIVVRGRGTGAAGDGGADGRKGHCRCHVSGRLEDFLHVCDGCMSFTGCWPRIIWVVMSSGNE